MPGTVKYSTSYFSLQLAFDSLVPGDILYINDDYVLNSTVTLNNKHYVKIIGLGEISPAVNGMTCIKIKNSEGTYVNDIVLERLRINNTAPEGTGSGVGIDLDSGYVCPPPPALCGGLYHVRIQDCNIHNFHFGLKLLDAFDIFIDNCQIFGCEVAVRSELFAKGVGQIKIVGGFMINNDYGISIDHASTDPTELSQGQVSVFGCTFGHKRDPLSNGPGQIAVYVAKPITGIYLFGNSFEDVANAVYFDDNFPVYTGSPPMVLAAIGNSFFNMEFGTVPGWWIDTHAADSGMGAVAVVGNTASHNAVPPDPAATPALVNVPKVLTTGKGGVMLGGNAFNAYPPFSTFVPNNVYPKELSSQCYPLPAYTTLNRPLASSLPPGFTIFNISTNKINTSNGSNWRDANGNPV